MRRKDEDPTGVPDAPTLSNPGRERQAIASAPPEAALDDTMATGSAPPARRSDSSLDDTMAAGSAPPARLSDSSSLDDTMAAGSQSATPRATVVVRGPSASREPERGDALDHFIVVDRLGVGGMGVVLAAYDPDLDRKVAIKLLKPTRSGDAADGQARLLREAQAMARLSHPNVVTVHEVGVIGDRVFIAMEYVDGGTLKRRDGDEPPTWRQVLDRYVAAGRGLAAAHRAGLVHRDFKPENVLVGRDGRVRVTDFGLVDVRDAKSPAVATAEVATTGTTASMRLGPDLTATGSIMGTPAYMAPEQHAGGQVDARADQYAFCVSLFEALHGERPFSGETYEQLVEKVNAGEITVAPHPDVPAWLRRVVVRGLATRPEDRYASMDELLAELSYELRARRRTTALVVAGFVATVGAGGGAVWYARGEPVIADEPCGGAAELVAGVWDDRVRATVRAAFERTKLGYAGEAFERSAAQLDGFTGRWVDQRTDACRATRVRGEQSEALLDRRMFCLDGGLAKVRAITELLAGADADLVRRAVELTGSLPDLTACADTEALNAAFPPPEPAKAVAARPLKDRIERVTALVTIGRYAEAKPLLPALVEDTRALDYPPYLAMVLLTQGNVQRETAEFDAARATLLEAARVSAVAKLDTGIATAYGLVFHILGVLQNKPDEARAMRPFLEIAAARADESYVVAMMHEIAGGKAYLAAKFDEAIAEYREALRLFSKTEPHKIAGAHFNIGTTLRDQGKLDAALTELERGEQIAIERLGPTSPMAAKLASAIGATLFLKGDLAAAAPRLERALAAQEGAFGPHHSDVGDSWTILGLIRDRAIARGLRRCRGARSSQRRLSARQPRQPVQHHRRPRAGARQPARGAPIVDQAARPQAPPGRRARVIDRDVRGGARQPPGSATAARERARDPRSLAGPEDHGVRDCAVEPCDRLRSGPRSRPRQAREHPRARADDRAPGCDRGEHARDPATSGSDPRVGGRTRSRAPRARGDPRADEGQRQRQADRRSRIRAGEGSG
jgi:tetratricopeptide (TPR) repeat protein